MAKHATIEGLNELAAALAKAAARTQAAASVAVRDEVEAVREDAEQGAPNRTGELDSGIIGEARGITGTVSATTRHSGFVEHGTYKDEAQPFMAPAAERSRPRFVGRVTLAVKSALEGMGR